MRQKKVWYFDLVKEQRARSVRHAMSALRDGLPILVDGRRPLVVLAAETASGLNLREITDLAIEEPALLLAAGRARALGYDTSFPPETVLAFPVDPSSLTPEEVRGLADPTVPQHLTRLGEPTAVPMNGDIAVDLAKHAQLLPALIVGLTTTADAQRYATKGYPVVDGEDIVGQFNQPPSLERIATTELPLDVASVARAIVYRDSESGLHNIALIIGDPSKQSAPLVRVHSACFTGDVLGSLRCDCGPQLRRALERMSEEGSGVLLYLAQEGRGIGLTNKLRAYLLQERGQNTLEANHSLGWESDARCFGLAAAILKDLGIQTVRLLSNNPNKLESMSQFGIVVQSRVAHTIAPNGTNNRYLETKRTCCGHLTEQDQMGRTV
ncbi:GTP cyclohydrolase II [Methyloceanibacter sp. wino2]|uniref:GTP cyclohydrolase II n=1 Tax=Methyloceanibacter sp. wino2 TaxID=2170729 RepID=UPI00131EE5EB|nr:GTP cyclohydrolase II [Methyloceanibacter sp. wino2]